MNKKENKDLAILEAAETEFLVKGLEGTRMETIAKHAEVSKRTLYKYYPSKEDLFNALLGHRFQKMNKVLTYPFDEKRSLSEMFATVLDIKIGLCRDSQFLKIAKMLASEQIKQRNVDSEFLKKLGENQRNFEEWVIQCQNAKILSTTYSANQISSYFHALIDGIFVWPVILGQKSEHSEMEVQSNKTMILKSFLFAFGPKV